MTEELIYITADEALVLYGEMMGVGNADPAGLLRDRHLLESALARPRHAALYEDASPARQAATQLWGIARNHPLVDGNKRAAHLVAVTFLAVNGHGLRANEDEQFHLLLKVAAGELDVDAVEHWIQDHLVDRPAG